MVHYCTGSLALSLLVPAPMNEIFWTIEGWAVPWGQQHETRCRGDDAGARASRKATDTQLVAAEINTQPCNWLTELQFVDECRHRKEKKDRQTLSFNFLVICINAIVHHSLHCHDPLKA